jgi:ketosteroid isomerase-like protein
MSTTPGRKFFDEHMKYIYANDIDGMIDDQYTEDAVLFSPFDVLDTPPPHVVRGRAALKAFFQKYLAYQGSINVEELSNFSETENSIFFQAIFTSKTGRWAVGDAWHMTNGQIDTHYSFAQRLGDAS